MATTDDKKEVDVTKAGKTAPDATSRPVIVGHKPLLQQDPMVNEKAEAEPEAPKEEKLTPSRANKVIAPLETKEPVPEETKPEDKPAEEPKPEETAPAEASPASDDSAIVDAVAEQASAKKKQADASDAEQKKQAELEKMINDKKYFVPINVASQRRNAKWSIILLVLLILIVGAYLAIDAGLINLGIKLPVDLIKT